MTGSGRRSTSRPAPIGFFDGDRLVGYGEVVRHLARRRRRPPRLPRPRHRHPRSRSGCRQAARARAPSIIGMPVPQGSPGDRLLESLGYHIRWTSWVLELPPGADIPHRDAPDGYTVREARPDEYEACWTVTEDAFLEWSERERDSFEDWASNVTQATGLRAVEPAGRGRRRRRGRGRGGRAQERRLRVRRQARHPQGPARQGTRPVPADRRVRGGSRRTAAPAPSCPPTRAPARWRSTRRSGCGRPRCGCTGRSTSERRYAVDAPASRPAAARPHGPS